MVKRREIIEIDDDSSDDQLGLRRRHTQLQSSDSDPLRPRPLFAGRNSPFNSGMNDTFPDPVIDLEHNGDGPPRALRSHAARRLSSDSTSIAASMTNDLRDDLYDFDFGGNSIEPAFLDVGETGRETPQSPPWPDAGDNVTYGYDGCLREILDIFPDICHDHVQELYDAQMLSSVVGQEHHTVTQNIITQILDKGKYPKEKDRQKELKRKRLADSDDEEIAYLKNLERGEATFQYSHMAKLILQEDFPDIPRKYIDSKFKETNRFFAAYQSLELASRTREDSKNPPYERLKRIRPLTLPQNENLSWLDAMPSGAGGYGVQELKREIMAARKLRKKEQAKHQTKKDVGAAEAAKEKEYRDRGDILECDTCCDDYPTYKFTHCDGDCPHFLCFGCLQRYADTEIGNQRYRLNCLHDSGCTATYSRKERERALNPKTFDTLERLQQQAELKAANMAGLETCPFCDFAAICPSVKVDKEFRCRNPECERVSCRLCQKDSHVPMSCKEYKESLGVDERHAVEEAMTKALLKTCPKCAKQVLKQDGCNKIVCMCGGILCDYCGKDITKDGYNHFGREGSSKKCPTHDNFHERRKMEVQKAEAEAIKKARAENPHLTEEQLKLKFSQEVENDNPWPSFNPVMPGFDQYGPEVRQRLANRLGIPALQPPALQNMPGAFPIADIPPYRPIPPPQVFQHNYLLPGAAYQAPNPPHLVPGYQNAFLGPPPLPDRQRGPNRALPAFPGELLPFPPVRQPLRWDAPYDADVEPDEGVGNLRQARAFGNFDPGMLDAMHDGQRAYRQDHGLPVDVNAGRVEGEGRRRRGADRRKERH